jgi:hypothetical protein
MNETPQLRSASRPRLSVLPEHEVIRWRKMMYRHCLSAAFAIGILLMSGCNRHDGVLPKTDRNTSSQAPASNDSKRDVAPPGQTGTGAY